MVLPPKKLFQRLPASPTPIAPPPAFFRVKQVQMIDIQRGHLQQRKLRVREGGVRVVEEAALGRVPQTSRFAIWRGEPDSYASPSPTASCVVLMPFSKPPPEPE